VTLDDEVVIERETPLRHFLELEIANHDFLIRHDLS